MNWADDVAKKSGCSRTWIYVLSRRLGRRATTEDVEKSRNGNKGRPIKYKY